MSKIRVLCLSIWYPLSMSRYFEKALRNHPDIELKTTGPYTGSQIPWLGGMNLPEKYAKPPDIPLPFKPDVGRVSYALVKAQLGDWTPDIVLSIDAGITWTTKPFDGLSATIATDPHVLNYDHQRSISDRFFNMQLAYSQQGDIYLPYAYSKYDHYPVHIDGLEGGTWKDVDAVLIGMPYQNRFNWVERLKSKGVSIIFENGPIFDEYRVLANRARIGLNWSSLNDLTARFFETPAFGLAPVMNRVPDAHLFLAEDEDYLAFTEIDEAVEKVVFLRDHPEEITRISQNSYRKIQPHTYDARVQTLLKECGF